MPHPWPLGWRIAVVVMVTALFGGVAALFVSIGKPWTALGLVLSFVEMNVIGVRHARKQVQSP